MIEQIDTVDSLRRERVTLSVVAALLVALVWACLRWNPMSLVLIVGFVVAAALVVVVPRRPEVGVVALIAAAALDATGRVASVAGAQVTLYQLGALGMVAVVIWRVSAGKSRFHATPIDLPVAGFLVIAAASVVVASEPRRALVGLVSLVSSALLVYVVVTLIDRVEQARTVLFGLIALGVVWGVLGIAETRGLVSFGEAVLGGGVIRARATFDDPNVLGEFLMMVALLALPLCATASRRARVYVGLGSLVCVAGIVATASRGALVGLAVGVVVILSLVRVRARYRLALFAGLALLGVFVAVFVLDPAWIQDRVLNIARDPSWNDRISMARAALALSADHPWGVGAANYPIVYPFYRVGGVRSSLVESHTMLATILVEYGVIGTLVFLWLLWRALSRTFLASIRTPTGELHSMIVGALAAGVALLAQSFTYSLETSKFLWFTIGFGMALWQIAGRGSRESL